MLATQAAQDSKVADMAAQDSDTDIVAPRKLTNVEKSRRPNAFRRLEVALRSFRVLKNLTAEQVDNFMNSYVIYDLDWADEKMMIETLGPNYQERVGECLRDYYSVLNHMCAIGELEKMYVPPIMDMEANIFTNQILYEETIAEELELPDDAHVLDLGCGRGRVAAHMTELTGARVTGINIDFDQVASAVAYNKELHFSNDFIRRDFNELPLPLPDAEFDGFYQIQAFSLCKDIPALCKELYRVLKPGAKLSLLDWASLEAYNPDDPHHRELMRCIKPLIGAVGTPTPKSLVADLESAGFKVLKSNNASINGLQSPLIESADRYFATFRFALRGLVKFGMLPAHFITLFDKFSKDGEAFMEADKSRLITTCYHWLAEKPKDEQPTANGTIATPAPEATLSAPLDPSATSEVSTNENDAAKAESAMSSNSATPASSSSSDAGLQSPSPANSDSTGITEPPSAFDETMKSELAHSSNGAPIEATH